MSCYDGHNVCSVQMHVTQEDTGCVPLLNNAPPLTTLYVTAVLTIEPASAVEPEPVCACHT